MDIFEHFTSSLHCVYINPLYFSITIRLHTEWLDKQKGKREKVEHFNAFQWGLLVRGFLVRVSNETFQWDFRMRHRRLHGFANFTADTLDQMKSLGLLWIPKENWRMAIRNGNFAVDRVCCTLMLFWLAEMEHYDDRMTKWSTLRPVTGFDFETFELKLCQESCSKTVWLKGWVKFARFKLQDM